MEEQDVDDVTPPSNWSGEKHEDATGEEENHKGVKAGDTVRYVPGHAHAFQRDPQGNYPWVMGKRHVRQHSGKRETVEEIEELDSRQVTDYLSYLSRSPSSPSGEEGKNLVLLRPATTWRSLVRAVNSDGTCDLDIDAGNGFTLHYDRVPCDSAGTTPGSFHTGTASAEEPASASDASPRSGHGSGR